MKKIMIILMPLMFLSCGAVDRTLANLTGDASEVCHKGVIYLQFTSGSTVALDANGKPLTCRYQ